jgi:DNA/RNA-binding domain of Phe-tRNA-synthetase-like protein
MTTMIEINVTEQWRAAHPGGSVGVLILRDVRNPPESAALDAHKTALEADLRERYGAMTRAELRALPTLRAYADYYKRFDKTYHVQLQLESVALKGKSLPRVAALVEAMFVAELRSQLLTAGHDLAAIAPPLRIDSARGDDIYTLANGQQATLKPGDMYMADAHGVICSILYGQDDHSRLAPTTRDALFVVYAPPGVAPAAVEAHLRDIAALVREFAPDAREDGLQVFHQ